MAQKPSTELVTIDVTAIEKISTAEINQQIATAMRYPRDVPASIALAKALVTTDLDTADDCYYSLPRREDGKVKFIEGPSIRFAEALAYAWGNSRMVGRIVNEGEQFITAQGMFHDLQTNVAVGFEVQRRIVGKNGNRYGPDMIGVTANAAASIALRNAVLRVIPKALWQSAYLAARAMVAGDFKHLDQRRQDAIAGFGAMGVPLENLLATMNVEAVEQITAENIVTLRGLYNAIRREETTVAEAFPDNIPATFGAPRVDLSAKLRRKAADGPVIDSQAQTDLSSGTAAQAVPQEKPARKAAAKKAQPAAAPADGGGDEAAAAAGAGNGDVPREGKVAVVTEGLTKADEELIAEFTAAINEVVSAEAVQAVASEFEGAFDLASPKVQRTLANLQDARLQQLKPKGKGVLDL